MTEKFWHPILKNSLPSTQCYLKNRWKELPDRSYVVAETQTEGQGRKQRSWVSAPGGLYFSVLLKPDTEITHLPWRVWLTNLKVLEIVSKKPLQLKAPNDILYDNRKLSGTLIDGSIQGEKVNFYIIGVGINIANLFPGSINACSLKTLLGTAPDKKQVLKLWLDTFEQTIYLQTQEWIQNIRDPYIKRSVQIGYEDPYWINLEEYWNAQ